MLSLLLIKVIKISTESCFGVCLRDVIASELVNELEISLLRMPTFSPFGRESFADEALRLFSSRLVSSQAVASRPVPRQRYFIRHDTPPRASPYLAEFSRRIQRSLLSRGRFHCRLTTPRRFAQLVSNDAAERRGPLECTYILNLTYAPAPRKPSQAHCVPLPLPFHSHPSPPLLLHPSLLLSLRPLPLFASDVCL